MSTSIDCQTKDSICDFLLKEGIVRDLGLYRFLSKEGNSSYRLYNRAVDESSKQEAVEYELEINDWNVWAQPSPILDYYGVHKFYGGYGKANNAQMCHSSPQVCNKKHFWICRIQQYVYCDEWLFCAKVNLQ